MPKLTFRRPVGRRSFLLGSAAFGGGLVAGLPGTALGQAPAVITSDRMRPQTAQGVMSGDVTTNQAVIWSRADRPARMVVDYATTESFTDPRRVRGPHALEPNDFTSRVVLTDLPAGQ